MARVINLHYHEGQPAFDFLDMAGTMKPVFFGMSLGKAVDPARVPTYAREKTRNKKLYDIFSMPGLNGVSQRFRDLVEEFEPGVHQFFPLRLSRRDGTPIEGYHYVFNCFVRADTVLVDRSGLSWGEYSNGMPYAEARHGQLLFVSRPAIGRRHIWFENYVRLHRVCVSEEFYAAMRACKIRAFRENNVLEELDVPYLAEENVKPQLEWLRDHPERLEFFSTDLPPEYLPTPAGQVVMPVRPFPHDARPATPDDFEEAEWIVRQRREVLHVVGTRWNWDHGSDVPAAIVAHPDCDAGTARTIFWLAYFSATEIADFSPEGRVVVEKGNLEGLQELFVAIGKRAKAGFYGTNSFASGFPKITRSDGIRLSAKLRAARAAGLVDWELSPVLLWGGSSVLSRADFTQREIVEMNAVLLDSSAF